MKGVVAAIALVAGCTFEHGTLSPGAATEDASAGGHQDASASAAACTTPGQRVCSDATHSATCDAALVAQVDRACPPSSMCSAGYCQPPAGATSCSKGSDCSGGQVCDLYVSGTALVGYCTNPIGTSTSCSTPGYDNNCVTGICARDTDDEERCLLPCESGNDWTCPGDETCDLVGAPQAIEGVSTSGQYACLGSD